jgi:hypothetical protein
MNSLLFVDKLFNTHNDSSKMTKSFSKPLLIFLTIIISIVGVIIISFAFIYFATPTRLAYPKTDHSHIRLQYVYHGKSEDFGSNKYQVKYDKNVCNGGITDTPLHFHDNEDQVLHLHWQRLTGGDILKYYGNNKTVGLGNVMGFRLDKLAINHFPDVVNNFGDILPKTEKEDKYYVYTGEKDNYIKRDFNDFINKDIESFLGKNSILREQFEEVNKTSNIFETNVYAHSEVTKNSNKSEEELKQINNLLGNIVIFVQKDEPSNDKVKERFDNLAPLEDSVCGG